MKSLTSEALKKCRVSLKATDDGLRKHRFLILGGCGFIGKNLVHYLVATGVANKIRVIDKVMPQLAYLNEEQKDSFSSPLVEFVSGNLIRKDCQEKAFEDDSPFDYVINLTTESRTGFTDAVYEEGILRLGVSCARLAALHKVKRFVEISSGCVFSQNVPCKEDDTAFDPWTIEAKFKLMLENELKAIPGLKYTIIRPAFVYGCGDFSNIGQRLVLAAVYKHLKEPMKLLWNRNLGTNTVHVMDLCHAMLHLMRTDVATSQIYHVSDLSDSVQGSIMDLMIPIFGTTVQFIDNFFVSAASKADLEAVLDELNDKHAVAWGEMCKQGCITRTPFSAYLSKDRIQNKSLRLANKKLVETGYSFVVPYIEEQYVREMLTDYEKMNIFPRGHSL